MNRLSWLVLPIYQGRNVSKSLDGIIQRTYYYDGRSYEERCKSPVVQTTGTVKGCSIFDRNVRENAQSSNFDVITFISNVEDVGTFLFPYRRSSKVYRHLYNLSLIVSKCIFQAFEIYFKKLLYKTVLFNKLTPFTYPYEYKKSLPQCYSLRSSTRKYAVKLQRLSTAINLPFLTLLDVMLKQALRIQDHETDI